MIKRIAIVCLSSAALLGCRHYDNYPRVSDQRGLVPADQWASYGHEEAMAIAIGRAFAAAYGGTAPDARAAQMGEALAYATSLGVQVEVADTLGHRLEVRFPSGWRRAILPIEDGHAAADTPGMPGGS